MVNINKDNDIPLIEKYNQGDIRSLETIYNKYKKQLLRLIWCYVYNAHDAEDILQTLFLKLMNCLDKYKPYKNVKFKTWLYKVATNTAKDFLRKKKRFIHLDKIDFIEDKHSRVVEKIEEDQMIKEMRKNVLSLPLKYREVVSLVVFNEFKYEEAATILNKPVGTIKSRMNYALNLLKKKFKVKDYE